MIKSDFLITTGMVWPVSSDKWKAPLDAFYDREEVDKTFCAWFCELFILHTVYLQQLKGMQSPKL